MSYEIVYNRHFLKIDGKIIPLTLHGSNNCYMVAYNGREKRERYWSALYLGENTMIAQTENDIMERINSYCGGDYQEHFKRNGKWIDDKGLINFFKNGIKNAKTIEELKEKYYFSGLCGYFSIWNKMDCKIENRVNIYSSDELREYLIKAQKRLENKTDDEKIYINLEYYGEKLEPREKKVRKPKERLKDYYVIKLDNIGYVTKLTSKRIMYSYCIYNRTKQFETSKQANKYIEKLTERFKDTVFEVEHIVE